MDDSAILDAIRSCSLFEALPEGEQRELVRKTEQRQMEAGEILFHRGDPANRVYLVHDGQIKLTQVTAAGEEVIVALLADGDLFAVVAAMQETSYPVAAEAMIPTDLLAWHRDLLAAEMDRYPAMSLEATRIVSIRMRGLQERFRELATLPVPARLARALVRLARLHGERRGDRVILDLQLSRQTLAELTGTTLYTVSRLLSGWKNEGLVELGRQRVTILDLPALGKRSEPE
ncbi:MAG: Crp/Fnr family transcriptional regulator [Thermoanaerobaculia bacterium]|nr:Crp/Fnr family transcriptional regulator [Thermoanaerobaculia bacterium]